MTFSTFTRFYRGGVHERVRYKTVISARSSSSLSEGYKQTYGETVEERSSASSHRDSHTALDGLNSLIANSSNGWMPLQNQPDEWIQYDSREMGQILEGNQIQKCPDGSHILSYSCSCIDWVGTEVLLVNAFTNGTLFPLDFSNRDSNFHFVQPTLCGIIRLYPKTWSSDICVIWTPLFTFGTYRILQGKRPL